MPLASYCVLVFHMLTLCTILIILFALLFSCAVKARDSVCSRTQCALLPPSVVEIEHIPTLEAHSTYVSRPLKYAAAVGPPGKV